MSISLSKIILSMVLLGILVFAFAPGNWTPAWIVNHDKFSHMLVFFSLAMILKFSFPNISMIYHVLLLGAFALFIELFQYALFNRGFSYLDIVFDLVGILSFVVLMKGRAHLMAKFVNS